MKRIKLGKTEIDQETFECWIAEMGSSQYRANQYELFKHNCNNFSEDVAQFLGIFATLFFEVPESQTFRGIIIFEEFKFSTNLIFLNLRVIQTEPLLRLNNTNRFFQ